MRTALSFLRGRDGTPYADDALADRAVANMPAGTGDPELDVVRARYAGEFKAALEGALAKLQAQDRTVLRLHYVDGLNIDQIGGIYRVHRSTVARWIARTREGLLAEARQVLMTQLRLTTKEFQSLVAAMQSQIHLSIHRFLGHEE
jgi:RNA polymerase sigma-70 factor, ECF subfamily